MSQNHGFANTSRLKSAASMDAFSISSSDSRCALNGGEAGCWKMICIIYVYRITQLTCFFGGLAWTIKMAQIFSPLKPHFNFVKVWKQESWSCSAPLHEKVGVMYYIVIWGFPKWWVSPTTIGFPTKNDHFGVFWGYHHLRKHPYSLHSTRLFLLGDTVRLPTIRQTLWGMSSHTWWQARCLQKGWLRGWMGPRAPERATEGMEMCEKILYPAMFTRK